MKPSLIIVGLGNPGKQYEKTRHNAGFLALDFLAKKTEAGEWQDKQKFLALIAEGTLDGKAVLLVKPTTYMNLSGQCIKKLLDFYKLDPAKQLLVLSDDIDLPLGTHRFRTSGGPGTHNGLKSIVEIYGENFPRHRIGLGTQPEKMDLAAWVLSAMSDADIKAMQPSMEAALDSAKELLK
jgi:PTH1 family peptidyl-tRNA hydrolase